VEGEIQRHRHFLHQGYAYEALEGAIAALLRLAGHLGRFSNRPDWRLSVWRNRTMLEANLFLFRGFDVDRGAQRDHSQLASTLEPAVERSVTHRAPPGGGGERRKHG